MSINLKFIIVGEVTRVFEAYELLTSIIKYRIVGLE
jgi:hypothetical protein